MASLKTTTTQNDDRELACSNHSSPSVFEEASPRQTHGETGRSEAIALGALGGQGVHLSEDSKGPNVKKAFFTLTGAGFLTLVVIWLNAIWLFGSLNQSGSRAARLKVSSAGHRADCSASQLISCDIIVGTRRGFRSGSNRELSHTSCFQCSGGRTSANVRDSVGQRD